MQRSLNGRRIRTAIYLIALAGVAALMASAYAHHRQAAADLAEHCATPAAEALQAKLACMTYGR